MGAFDKIKSGLPGMDELLNYIRMGDNVVWSVADLEDFKFFAIPFAEQAIRDGRNLIYMRFADHEPLLTPRPGLKICEFDPDKGFEAFTVDIHDRIAEEGRGCVLCVRQPVVPPVRMVHRSDDGQLFPRDLPLPVPAGHSGIFPAAAGQTFF